MIPRAPLSSARQVLPLALFAAIIITLSLNAAISLGDIFASRQSLATDNALLEKLKARSVEESAHPKIQPDNYVFEFSSQGLASAEFQRRVAELLAGTNADLQLSEIIPPDPDGDVGRLAIAVNFEINETSVIDLLHAIENAKPALVIERLALRMASGNDPLKSGRLQGTATIIAGWRSAQ